MLGNIEYVPLLCAKRAELKAFRQLTKPVRSNLFPVFALRPFPNARNISHAIKKVDEASEGFRYGLDLDWSKRSATGLEPAATEMRAFFDPASGYQCYFDLVASAPNRVPVLRDNGAKFDEVMAQQQRADGLGRGLVIRINRTLGASISELLLSLSMNVDDILFVVDVGWSKDVLSQILWASGVIRNINDWNTESEIVIAGSSFPNSFSNINGVGAISIDERTLFDNLKRLHNQAKIVYGDWGSTRDYDERMGGGGVIPNRIDVADRSTWTAFRADGSISSYPSLASAIIGNPVWLTIPDCWGKGVIESTKLSVPGRILNAEAAAAARINMHLTVQALASDPEVVDEEPYLDKF